MQANNLMVPLKVPKAILPTTINRKSFKCEQSETSSQHLGTVDLSFEMDSLVPVVVEVYAGVVPTVIDRKALITTKRAIGTSIKTAMLRISDPSSRQPSNNNSSTPLSVLTAGSSYQDIELEPIANTNEMPLIQGIGQFDLKGVFGTSDALYAMERLRVDAGLKQEVHIKNIPLVDSLQLFQLGRSSRSPIKEDANIYPTDTEVLSSSSKHIILFPVD